jgi:hypothetical protein
LLSSGIDEFVFDVRDGRVLEADDETDKRVLSGACLSNVGLPLFDR